MRLTFILRFACVLLASALMLTAPVARADSVQTISVVNAWSRATPPGTSVGVAYFEIINSGKPDTLQAIQSEVAERVEMHSAKTVNGMMQMREMPSVDIAASAHVRFEPGGLHAMLMGLHRPLAEGEHIALTLVFAHAGAVRASALVQGLGAQGPPIALAPDNASGVFRLATWPRHAAAPEFRLVDFDGHVRTLADYRGRALVVFFGFVHCPDACPAELFKLALVMKRLGPLRDRVQVAFITLDPKRDTGPRLRNYVRAFDPHFIGLTGSTAQIDRAANSFSVEYAKVGTGTDYTIDHSTATFIFDAAGELRLVGAMNTGADDYAHDLAVLAAPTDITSRAIGARADP